MPPLIGTAGAASAQGFGFFSASLGGPYWAFTYQTDQIFSGVNQSVNAIGVGASNNFYIVGLKSAFGGCCNQIYGRVNLTISSAGALTRQDWLRPSTDSYGQVSGSRYAGGYDSSENVYGISEERLYFAASSTGTNIYSKDMASGSPRFQSSGVRQAKTDASGNLYITGSYLANSDPVQNGTLVFKIAPTTGNILFAARQTSGLVNDNGGYGTAVAVDSSGNIYVVGRRDRIFKLNSSGVVQAQVRIENCPIEDMAVASNGDLYVVGQFSSTAAIIKLNSSFAFQWGVGVTAASAGRAVVVDPSGTAYMSFSGPTASNTIVKVSSSGTVLWQRVVTGSGSSAESANSILAFDKSQDLFFGSNIFPKKVLGLRVPASGAKTGTYTLGSDTVTYAAGSASVASITPTISTPTDTMSTNLTPSLNNVTTSNQATTGTYTSAAL